MATPMTDPDTLPKLKMYIDGAFVDPVSGEYFESFDPYTAKPYVRFYTRLRVGGDVLNFESLKFLKFGTS